MCISCMVSFWSLSRGHQGSLFKSPSPLLIGVWDLASSNHLSKTFWWFMGDWNSKEEAGGSWVSWDGGSCWSTRMRWCRCLGEHEAEQALGSGCSLVWSWGVRYVCAQSLSHVQLSVTPWTAACQAPLSMRILQGRIPEWAAMPSSRGIFPTQGLKKPGLPHCGQILYHLSHQGSPRILEWVAYPSPGYLSNPGIELGSSALQVDSLAAELPGKPSPEMTSGFSSPVSGSCIQPCSAMLVCLSHGPGVGSWFQSVTNILSALLTSNQMLWLPFLWWSSLSPLIFIILISVATTQMVKNPPAMQETWVQSLGQENPLGEGVAGVFLLENPYGQRSLVGYSSWGCKESDTTEWLTLTLTTMKLSDFCLFNSTSWKAQMSEKVGGK